MAKYHLNTLGRSWAHSLDGTGTVLHRSRDSHIAPAPARYRNLVHLPVLL